MGIFEEISLILFCNFKSGVLAISITTTSEIHSSKFPISLKNAEVEDILSGFLSSNNAEITDVSKYILNILFISNHLFIQKAEMSSIAYYYMVKNLYTHYLAAFNKPLCYLNILQAWRRVSAWVIVDDYYGCS